ncbi:MAG: hypothetical protein HYZ69_01495 [Candidatus Colwellbacteria bacterium]|nr:hypothetical protein [Candidatus Colwellbacteria bacterium]
MDGERETCPHCGFKKVEATIELGGKVLVCSNNECDVVQYHWYCCYHTGGAWVVGSPTAPMGFREWKAAGRPLE